MLKEIIAFIINNRFYQSFFNIIFYLFEIITFIERNADKNLLTTANLSKFEKSNRGYNIKFDKITYANHSKEAHDRDEMVDI